MATPSTTFTEMVSTTLRAHPSMVADNVTNHNPLYARLKSKGKLKTLSGGYEIVEPLDYAENSTFQRYSGYDTLNVQASDVITAAKYDWVQSAVHVTASGRELRQNSGKEAMINLVQTRVTNARRTAANNMSVDIYGSQSLSNQMGGLGHIIPSAGTGTVGGINSSTWTFWQSTAKNAAATPTASNIKADMQVIWLSLCRGADKPDLIVGSHDMYGFYWDALTDLQRFSGSAGIQGYGGQTLKFVDADVVFDTNTNLSTTAKVMYFLNTDYLSLVSHSQANWSMLEEKTSINQDAAVTPLIWMGQMCCSNRSLQGKLHDDS